MLERALRDLLVSASAPVGTVSAFAGASAPDGWLLCDGAFAGRTAKPGLFAAIGTTWGAGDGVSTFQLPDLTGGTIDGQVMTWIIKAAQ